MTPYHGRESSQQYNPAQSIDQQHLPTVSPERSAHFCALPILCPAYAATTINFSLRLQASMSCSLSGVFLLLINAPNRLSFVFLLTRRLRHFFIYLYFFLPSHLHSRVIVATIFLSKIFYWLGEPVGIPAKFPSQSGCFFRLSSTPDYVAAVFGHTVPFFRCRATSILTQ